MSNVNLLIHLDLYFLVIRSKECLPHLKRSNHAHILNISPPLVMHPEWFGGHVAYSIAKFGMSMCALGMAEEFKKEPIAVNTLWPAAIVHTAAVDMLHGDGVEQISRKAEIMADAAYAILTKDPRVCTGNFFIDEDVLRGEGVKDFAEYSCVPGNEDRLQRCIFAEQTNKAKL